MDVTAIIRDHTYTDETVTITRGDFENCTFTRCHLQGEPMRWVGNTLIDCTGYAPPETDVVESHGRVFEVRENAAKADELFRGDDIASLRARMESMEVTMASKLGEILACLKKRPKQERALVPAECPFCGNDDVELGEDPSALAYNLIFVSCMNCDARGLAVMTGPDAIEQWNDRVKP